MKVFGIQCKVPVGLPLTMAILSTVASTVTGQPDPPDGTRRAGAEPPRSIASTTPGSSNEPTAELTLRDALRLALLHNPDLATFSWELRAREAARLQAGAWPNPELAFEYENFAGSGALQGTNAAEATVALSQLVLLGGKRGKRAEVAHLDSRIASWEYENARLRTHAAVAAAFIDVLAAQERVALAERIVAVTREVREAVSERVRAGGTLALEENRAQVAVETSLIETELAVRGLTRARHELAALWGSEAPRFTRAVGALETVVEPPDADSLLLRVDGNPEIARWTAEVQRERARVRLLQADRVPDISVGVGVRHHAADDDVALVVGASLPIPTWNRNAAAAREAELRSERANHARRAAEVDIRRAVLSTYEELAGAYDELVRLRDRVLPEARSAVDRSGEAYRAGAVQLTDVLDIQRTFFRMRLRYVEALARYHRAVAQIEGWVGLPRAGVPQSDDGEGG